MTSCESARVGNDPGPWFFWTRRSWSIQIEHLAKPYSDASALEIQGNVWTFPWETKDGDKTTYFRVVNVFMAPDSIEYRLEYSAIK